MKTFNLVRHEDVSGVSGVGVVAEGVVFKDGVIALRWCVNGMPKTTVVHENIESVKMIHGHDGKTTLSWL